MPVGKCRCGLLTEGYLPGLGGGLLESLGAVGRCVKTV